MVKTITAACFSFGLVVIARAKHPIPSRTRPLSAVAPMVLRLKTWESRSPPNLTRRNLSLYDSKTVPTQISAPGYTVAGWSSPVARQAHNLKVTGSNPVPATKLSSKIKDLNVERFACVSLCAKHLNATSTFDESPLKSAKQRFVGWPTDVLFVRGSGPRRRGGWPGRGRLCW